MMRGMRGRVLVAIALAGCAHSNRTTDVDPAPDTPPVDPCGGLPCTAIYVSPSGADVASGSRAAPAKTITAGIAKAAASTTGAVFVQAGSYAEAVVMKPGVTIYGGFDASWNRDDAAVTEIAAASPAVTFDAINVANGLDHVTVKSADATAPGASSIAVLVTGSTMIALDSVTLVAGAGASGVDGVGGGNGASGSTGRDGGKGVEHSSSFGCDNN